MGLATLGTVICLTVVISVIRVVANSASNVATRPPWQPAASQPSASQPASSAPSSSNLSGPVGTTYSVTDNSGNIYDITLTRTIDPARGADQFNAPSNGFRFVGAVLSLKGVSGHSSDDVNLDAMLIGSDGQTYQADFNRIAGYTNFNSGQFSISTGQTSTGAVTFQVPHGVSVARIQWDSTGGFRGQPVEWVIH